MSKGLITEEQLRSALEEQMKNDEFLGKILLRNNWVKKDDLLKALAEQFNIPYVSLKYKYINLELIKKFSPSLIIDYRCFPITMDEHSITIAITNPLEAWTIKKCEEETRGFKLKLVLTSEEDMEEIINRYLIYKRRRII